MFLKHAIKEYEFDCKARKLGVNTIQGYMRMLRYLMDYLDKEYDITQIEDVEPFHIKHFLLLKQEEGKKPQYSDENHYLLGYDGEKVRPYRIDRMEGVKAEKAMPRQGQEVFDEKIDLDHYRQYTFGMYDGKVETVRLRFFHRMMNTVIDKFGSDVVVYKVDGEHFEIEVPVAVSPQFFGWIFGLGGQVQIMSPKPVVRKMKEMLKRVGDKYQ